jgi:hypothetical protein
MNTRILKKLDNLEKGYKELCNSNSANNFIHIKNLAVVKELKKTIEENWNENQKIFRELLETNKTMFIAIKQLQNKIDKK